MIIFLFSMLTIGQNLPVAVCKLSCTGQGPIISLQPTKMDFGDVQVLQEKIMKLKVISDSPIPAQFKISLVNSPWSVDQVTGELEENESMELNVKIYLRDPGKYEDNISLMIHNNRLTTVNLKAVGVGCSIVFQPNIFPIFDMGLLLSHQMVNIPITMKNLGMKQYQLMWSNTPDLHMQKGQIVSSIISKFRLYPVVTSLKPNETKIVHCKICWDQNETIMEDWYLFGCAQGQSKRELFGLSTFKTTFAEPYVVFNKKELTMQIDISPYGNEFHQIDEVIVTNKSGLDLNVHLKIKRPFYIISEEKEFTEKMKILLTNQATTKIYVKFAPDMETSNLYSKIYHSLLIFEYDEHPIKNKIKCKGSVNYPNLILSSHEVKMYCEKGCSEEYILKLTNNGPIPVIYKFVWLKETINIIRDIEKSARTLNAIEDQELKSWQNNDHLQNQQVGAGDAPSESLITPMNTPISNELETQRTYTGSEFEMSQDKSSKSEESEILQEIKKLLMNIVDMPTTDNSDIDVLKVIGFKPRFIEPINEILDIVQSEGIVPPYTSQNVHFGFHGFERIEVEVTAVCEIVCGPTEMIQVEAKADTVRYSVDRCVIDLGQQLFCESCDTYFNLINECNIAFTYTIITTSALENDDTIVQPSDLNRLTIVSREGKVEPKSSINITLNYRPIYLGPFNVEFRLKVAHLVPLVMSVTGVGIYPQIFFDLPQIIDTDKYPPELGYEALRSLFMEFIVDVKDHFLKIYMYQYNSSSEENKDNLIDNEWIMVSIDETFPTIIDINMAFEHIAAPRKTAIPQMFSLEYIIDLGNVIIGLTTHYSAILNNYGPKIAEVNMKKSKNKDTLINSEIVIEFKKNVSLLVNHSVLLQIICNPIVAKYTERYTTLERIIHLEVIHGCIIPVIIKGIITYPYITVDKKQLDFNKVIIGECSMMCLTMKNE
ncbi:hydrocephalus-inducing protein homolog [Vespula pensylvanica]|uniref:hydrocephalus-inducing protein homolog n=1 Tax=Vespula pensylvanica TaxID=30213 RepID=UPI001CBA2300|nr:hydrocephalus-inducing protein homolog [Vespula pensylvanica]